MKKINKISCKQRQSYPFLFRFSLNDRYYGYGNVSDAIYAINAILMNIQLNR